MGCAVVKEVDMSNDELNTLAWGGTLVPPPEMVKRLEAENKALRNEIEMGRRMCNQLMAKIGGLDVALHNQRAENEKLKAELASVQKDAERYRWLRNKEHWQTPSDYNSDNYLCHGPIKWSGHSYSWDEIDAAIDAAIAAQGEQG
jgi:multidrug resistance efflux pump